jgi:hypothetical protein
LVMGTVLDHLGPVDGGQLRVELAGDVGREHELGAQAPWTS